MSSPTTEQIFHDAWMQHEQVCQRLEAESDPAQRSTLEIQRDRFRGILARAPNLLTPAALQAGLVESSDGDMEDAWRQVLDEVPAHLLAVP